MVDKDTSTKEVKHFNISEFNLKVMNKVSDNLIHYFKYIYGNEKSLMNYLTNNKVVNIPKTIIAQSNERNLIVLRFNSGDYKITYMDRKIAVFGISIVSVILHYLRNRKGGMKYRWFIPYYFFYSLLLYREALNPLVNPLNPEYIALPK